MRLIPRAVVILGLLAATPAWAAFRDVPSMHPNAQAVAYVQAQGIVRGYADGSFRPDALINRAEFTKIIVGAVDARGEVAGCDLRTLSYFDDVSSKQWYAPFICYARAHGIAQGHLRTNMKPAFSPGENINAIEASKIISVAFGIGLPPLDCSANYGADCLAAAQQGDPWYKRHVDALADKGAIPLSVTSFQHYLTRGEMAEMIWRILDKRGDLPSQTYQSLELLSNPPATTVTPEPVPPSAFAPSPLSTVLSGVSTLSAPYTARQAGGALDLRVLTPQGSRSLLTFNENLPDQSIAQSYLLAPGGQIYIAGIGTDGVTVLDRGGADITASYAFLQGKKFPIAWYYRIDDDRYAYGVHGSDATEQQPAGLFVKSRKTGAVRAAAIPTGGLSGLAPLCLSADGQSLYARHVGWEGFEYGSVWKIRLSDMQAVTVITPVDKIVSYSCHDHTDLILGVRAEEDPTQGMGGEATAPSSLVLFDGARGTSRTLLQSADKLFGSAVFAPDGKSIVYTRITPDPHPQPDSGRYWGGESRSELHLLSLGASTDRMLGVYDGIEGMAQDAGVIIAKRAPANGGAYEYYAVAADGRYAPLEGTGIQMLSCGYGMGFDCLY